MNRRAFLHTSAASTLSLAAFPLRAAAPRVGLPTDEEILAQARERIEKHRKGDGVITVMANGKPVANAVVKVEQQRHEFRFGSNFFMFGRCRSPENETQYRERFSSLLNYATLGFYWSGYERERGKPNYDYTDSVLSWAGERGITCKGHPLAWDHPAGCPGWLPGDPVDIERLSTGRVRDIVERFKGRIGIWDVVNEPTDLKRFKNPMNTWAQKLGAIPFTRLHLNVARAANPDATLLVNDYRVDQPFYDILDALRNNGKLLFDTIGIQSHMHGGAWPLRKVWEVCDRFARLGVPIHFTETTLVSGPRLGPGENWGATTPELEAKQAESVAKFYTTLFAHPAAHALTWWDFSDQGAWQGAAAGFLRKDMSPKPAYDRLLGLIRGEWWTKQHGQTDGQGQLKMRAFYGTQRLIAQLPGGQSLSRDVAWERGKPNHYTLQ